jgi:hypothetical protein
MGSVAKSYARKDFLIYEEMRKYLTVLRRPLVILFIYNFATDPILNFLIYEENFILLFISVE